MVDLQMALNRMSLVADLFLCLVDVCVDCNVSFDIVFES